MSASMRRPRLLYAASRWPWPVREGHQRIIDQMLRYAAEVYDVTLAVLCPESEFGRVPPACK